jgi:opacity protein-like surface antigen
MLVGIATVVALFAAQQASAQTIIYLGGGATFPMGDFGDFANTGWQAVGGVLVPVGPAGLSVGAEGFYGQNNHKEGEIGFLENSKTTPYGAMGVVSYGFQTSGKLTPYVFGGLGVLVHKFSAEGISQSETQFGYEGGAGIDFALSPKLGIWIEGRYMGSSDTQFIAADAGLAFAVGGGE